MIYKHKSVRNYAGVPVETEKLDEIKTFAANMKPLYPQINVRCEIIAKEQVKCLCPWTTPQVISIFSEVKDGYLENVGFIFQQLDLYLQSIGLGACWLGMGHLTTAGVQETQKDDNMKFVIMLAFGYPKGDAQRNHIGSFKRKEISEISDILDARLEPARLAPSSVNSQPWYFVHKSDLIHAYGVNHGLFKGKTLSPMNRIDIGIALAHMYVSNPDTFQFARYEQVEQVKGYTYVGSFSI